MTATAAALVEFKEGRGFEQGRQKKRSADKSTVLTVSLWPTKSLDEMCRRCVLQRQTPFQGASDHGEGGKNLGSLDEIRQGTVQTLEDSRCTRSACGISRSNVPGVVI